MNVRVKLHSNGDVSFSEVWPARRVEWLLGSCLLGVGIVYAFAAELFQQSLYLVHSKIMPREMWAAGAILIGMVRLCFLWVNGSWRRSPHWRALGAFLSCLWWFELSVAVWQAPLIGATVVIWPLFFCFDVSVALAAVTEAARSDVRHQEAAESQTSGAGEDGSRAA